MTHPNPSTALARVVVDELAAGGVRHLVISPGSRSAALAIASVEHDTIEARVVVDERSAAFHALGVALASQRPVAVLATSGTAPTNFYPAVVEADMSCVPLLAISADRPAELQGVGANQTIDQVALFGSKVRAYAGIDAPEPGIDANRDWRTTVGGLIAAAAGPKPGPVHLNVAFREPTVPVSDDGRTRSPPYPFETPRLARAPVTDDGPRHSFDIPPISPDRGVVIAGEGPYDRNAVQRETARLGWPLLATAQSHLRGEEVVTGYHYMLAEGVSDDFVPETVVAIGAIGPDPVLEELFSSARTRVRVDSWGRTIDPGRNATVSLAADPAEVLRRTEGTAQPGWLRSWLDEDERIRTRLAAALGERGQMSGGAVAAALNEVEWEALVVASSLPIREVDAHLRRAGRVYANRGASGIDGFVSTALGVASVVPRTLALSGDLSLLHDANGFLHDATIDITIVVVDNGGGGLFDSLPAAKHAPHYERLFVADPARDLAALARFHGARVETADDVGGLVAACNRALNRPGLDWILVPVDRVFDLKARTQPLE